MKKLLFILLVCIFTNHSFGQISGSDYQKGESGMEYKIVQSSKVDLIKVGQFLEMHFTNFLSRKGKQDSVLNNTREIGAAQFMQLDTVNIPPAYLLIFKQMSIGDSVSTRTLSDSMFKDNPIQMPPFIKKGDFIYTNIKIENVYKTQEEADSAKKIAMENAEKVATIKAEIQVNLDERAIADYISNNKVEALKTLDGVYVETIKPGNGPYLDSNSIVKVKYTGTTLNGVMFDSNVDPSKGHTDPLTVNLTNDKSIGNGVIPGLENGLYKLQKGSKAKIYIPSGLGYGPRGAGADIPPNANLVFDIEVLGIITKAQLLAENKAAAAKAKAEQAAQQKLIQQQQKVYEDSLQKADPKKFEEYKQQMQKEMMQQMNGQSIDETEGQKKSFPKTKRKTTTKRKKNTKR
jgi:FKBP-type peptidyl-prolyl cis-trans isomerase FkpA